MKRSAWLKLASLVTQFRDSATSSSYNYDDYSSGKDDGSSWAYDFAADEVESVMESLAVTEEDAVVCSGPPFKNYCGGMVKVHELGSRPMHHGLFVAALGRGESFGCTVCDEFVKAKA